MCTQALRCACNRTTIIKEDRKNRPRDYDARSRGPVAFVNDSRGRRKEGSPPLANRVTVINARQRFPRPTGVVVTPFSARRTKQNEQKINAYPRNRFERSAANRRGCFAKRKKRLFVLVAVVFKREDVFCTITRRKNAIVIRIRSET